MKALNGLIVTSAVMVSATAFARTDIASKVEQLNLNRESSQENLKQYEENQKVVEMNLSEVQKAIDALKTQKTALKKQTGDVEKGKIQIAANRKKIEGWLKSEEIKLDQERKQAFELKKQMEKLEKNQRDREAAIAAYRERLQKADQDIANWSLRKDEIADLEKALTEKENQALADKKHLMTKRSTYEDEVTKWKKQVRVSEREYQQFSKLK